MRESMINLSELLGRHRRLVLAAWFALLLIALPFAARQTEHLTGGGFDVPGSESKAVADSVQKDFDSSSEGIAVVLRAEPGVSRADLAASVGRARRTIAGVEGLAVSPAA